MMMPIIRCPFTRTIPLLAFFFLTLVAPVKTIAADGVPDRCTNCHAEVEIVEKVAKMPAKERAKKLEAFLTNHYTPDPVERAAIVAALKAKAEKR